MKTLTSQGSPPKALQPSNSQEKYRKKVGPKQYGQAFTPPLPQTGNAQIDVAPSSKGASLRSSSSSRLLTSQHLTDDN